jgi:release factor glutamine methyltransferase
VTSQAAPTVAAILEAAIRRLRDADVPDPQRDAAVLLALALRTDRGGVLARKPDPVDPEGVARIDALIASRARRIPLQHLEGYANSEDCASKSTRTS